MIGGQGADSMEGGTGDDQIYGDGSEEIGGLPDGDLNHAGDDVIAGDVLNNGFEFSGGEGGPRQTVTLAEYGDDVRADVVLGGHDTIIAGNGNDMASDAALANGPEAATAFTYSDHSNARPQADFSPTDPRTPHPTTHSA